MKINRKSRSTAPTKFLLLPDHSIQLPDRSTSHGRRLHIINKFCTAAAKSLHFIPESLSLKPRSINTVIKSTEAIHGRRRVQEVLHTHTSAHCHANTCGDETLTVTTEFQHLLQNNLNRGDEVCNNTKKH